MSERYDVPVPVDPVPGARPSRVIEADDDAPGLKAGLFVVGVGEVVMGSPLDFTKAG